MMRPTTVLPIVLLLAGADVEASPAPKYHPLPFSHSLSVRLTAYIDTLIVRERLPGASVAVVQNGRVIYEHGFGIRELGKPDPVTPSTLMMIGSCGKSMTTMMMATAVDEGKISWDTPAIHVLPSFAVSDSTLTARITLRHLVCNCTGVARKDLEATFPGRPRTAEDMIRALRTFPFVGTFGSSFQYSNQMVATGGYLAARAAAGAGARDLRSTYQTEMMKRVFDPIGMTHTTFSFEHVAAVADHAIPHGRTANDQVRRIPLELEEMLSPIEPSGGEWSNIRDLSRYLLTQLRRGVAPSGRRVVSAENLERTWQPQVEARPGLSYGLGWVVTSYKGVRVLTHNGGTNGFTSNLTFLPDVGIGVAVLTNDQNQNAFVTAIPFRVMELLFRWPEEMHSKLFQGETHAKEALAEATRDVRSDANWALLTDFLGDYRNSELGSVRLEREGNKLILHAGPIVSQARATGDSTFVVWDPPIAGLTIRLAPKGPGGPSWTLVSTDPQEPGTWTFTR
jgi:CubicO group peptidase (beta-lactamase class C family)